MNKYIPQFMKFIHLTMCNQRGKGKEDGRGASIASREKRSNHSDISPGPTAEVG